MAGNQSFFEKIDKESKGLTEWFFTGQDYCLKLTCQNVVECILWCKYHDPIGSDLHKELFKIWIKGTAFNRKTIWSEEQDWITFSPTMPGMLIG